MSITRLITLPTGQVWGVGSNVLHWDQLSAEVLVPVDQLQGMTAEEVGQAILQLVPIARLWHITEYAGWLLQGRNSHTTLEEIEEDLAKLEPYVDSHPEIEEAFSYVLQRRDAYLALQQKRVAKAASTTPRPGFVYILEGVNQDCYKIGRTGNVDTRLKGIELPFPVIVKHTIATPDMVWAEKYLHTKYAGKRLNGEWFNLAPDEVAWICSLTQLEEGQTHD